MAMTDASNQDVWCRSFLMEPGYTINEHILLHRDNKGAIDLAENSWGLLAQSHMHAKGFVSHNVAIFNGSCHGIIIFFVVN